MSSAPDWNDLHAGKGPPDLDGTARAAGGATGKARGAQPTPATPASWDDRCLAIDPAWLSEPPPRRRWLLERPTRDGKPVQTGEGDGLLPLGEVGLFVADGGAGKSLALLALAVSVILGLPWLGWARVPFEARGGMVLLILAEESSDEIRRRLWSVCQALGLTTDQKALILQQLRIVARDKVPSGLLGGGRDLDGLLAWLKARGPWSLIGLDVYARLAPPEAETDQIVATDTMRAAESLTDVPGNPTVLLLHHASLDGVRLGQVRARGVTGIRNAARWEATLTPEKDCVLFIQSKSNVSIPWTGEPLRLVRGPGGVLRIETEEEEQAREERRAESKGAPSAEKEARAAAKLAEIKGAIVNELLTCKVPPRSRNELSGRLAVGKREQRMDAIAQMVGAGEVLDATPGKDGKPMRLPRRGPDQADLDLQ